jgi:hypothetical protein
MQGTNLHFLESYPKLNYNLAHWNQTDCKIQYTKSCLRSVNLVFFSQQSQVQVYFQMSLSRFANQRKIKVLIFLNVLCISKLCTFEQSTMVFCFRKMSKLDIINYHFRFKPKMIRSRIGLLLLHHSISDNSDIKWAGTSFLNEADARTLACFNKNLVTSVRMTGITIPFQPPKRLQLSQWYMKEELPCYRQINQGRRMTFHQNISL